MPSTLHDRALTESIIGAFFEVYNVLGTGFLEACYSRAMAVELKSRGHEVAPEAPVDIHYKGTRIGFHRIDLLVDQNVVVEIKASDLLAKNAEKQLLHYLKGSGLRVGLLLHFGPEPKFFRRVL